MTASQWTDNPDIIAVTGLELDAIRAAFTTTPASTLLVWMDEGGVKFKFGNGTWSPPFGQGTA